MLDDVEVGVLYFVLIWEIPVSKFIPASALNLPDHLSDLLTVFLAVEIQLSLHCCTTLPPTFNH